jgi:cullin 1
VAWKQNFFKHLNTSGGVSRLTQALLKQIELQRNGEPVDSGLLKRVIDSYGGVLALPVWHAADIYPVSLGLDEADAQRSNLEVYKEHFEGPFILATQAYYQAESADFVANNSVSDYMKKAEDRLQEESDRVNLYLNDATRKDVSQQIGYAHVHQADDPS